MEINVIAELKRELKLTQYKYELARQRAIDEVAAHHPNVSRLDATFDVDHEMMRHLRGIQ